MTPQSLGFSPAEAALLQNGPANSGQAAGDACLHGYGGGLVPSETYRLMAYHIRAAIELRLADHARRLYAGLVALLREHPDLIAEELCSSNAFQDRAPTASPRRPWRDGRRNPSRFPQRHVTAATVAMSAPQSRAIGGAVTSW